MDMREIFFPSLGENITACIEKQLFITACIEKQCSRPLNPNLS